MNLDRQQMPEDEIELRELFSIVWQGKWWIIGITLLFFVSTTFYVLYLPNEYRATAVVKPVEADSRGSLSSLASQFGGLASIAGFNIGTSNSTDSVVAIEVLKSWGFAENFIDKHGLAVALFAAKGWDQSSGKLILDSELYDSASKKWIRKPPTGKTVEPTSWELYKKYKENLSIDVNKETGLVSISFTHYNPIFAKQLVHFLVTDINNYMKDKALNEANKSIEYLEQNIKQTSVAEIRAIFSQLIQEQHKTKMLAQVSDEYIFKTISASKTPEEKSKPRRLVLIISGAFLGLILSMIFIFFIRFYRND